MAVEHTIGKPLTKHRPDYITSGTGQESSSKLTSYNYRIFEVKKSENAEVIFPSNDTTLVFKGLRSINDGRYNHKTPNEIQQAELQALSINREFTPEAYFGLARVKHHDRRRGEIILEEIIEHPKKSLLVPNATYELVMRRYNTRLDDYLLHASPKEVEQCLRYLTVYMAEMDSKRPLPTSDWQITLPDGQNENVPWGHPLQLQFALRDNLTHLSSKVGVELATRRVSAFFNKRRFHIPELQSADQALGLASLILPQAFHDTQYLLFFMERLNDGHIITAHGDPKPKNIFLELSDNQLVSDLKAVIKLLDANTIERYRYIDKLRNLALLIIPIGVLLNSRKDLRNFDADYLTDMMLNQYLDLTNQRTQSAQAVYDYHASDIAAVGAIMENFDGTGNEINYLQSLQKHIFNVVARLDLTELEKAGLRKFIFLK